MTEPEYPPRGYPPGARLDPTGTAMRARHATMGPVALGDTREFYDPILEHPELRNFTAVPGYYVVTLPLGPQDGASVTRNRQLRPEPFVLRRITYATTGDVPNPGIEFPFAGGAIPLYQGSIHARTVEVQWGDEFTQFLGKQRGLVASVFADSNGFLDVPNFALFQGSQFLEITLERILWPFAGVDDENKFITEWDFVFHGFGLLPKGVNQSGSVG